MGGMTYRTDDYRAERSRYDSMEYRRCGRSGLQLPPISLGLWHNFGDAEALVTQRAVLRRAFDLGVTHIDLANNYGPPHGSAERNFGTIFAEDLRPYRDELIISTKAGYDMWPGPYGQGGGSRKYLLASLDQSLQRMGLDYVDIFYSGPQRTREAYEILRDLGTPLLIHQPSYSMINRWIEEGLLDTLEDLGVGSIAFSPLAQGLLTDKYLDGIPEDSRAGREGTGIADQLTEDNLTRIRGLDAIAQERGQSLAQMALAWALRDSRVTSVLVGARHVGQLENSLGALDSANFTDEELRRIDEFAVDGGINWWAWSSRA